MNIVNPTKAFLALVTIICMTILIGLNRIATEAGVGVISVIVGYIVGNGVGAKTGSFSPIIGKKETPE